MPNTKLERDGSGSDSDDDKLPNTAGPKTPRYLEQEDIYANAQKKRKKEGRDGTASFGFGTGLILPNGNESNTEKPSSILTLPQVTMPQVGNNLSKELQR